MSSLHSAAYAVIVAGGSGQRVGTAIPKQFLTLAGRPVLFWSIKAFANALPGLHIVLVLPELYLDEGRKILAEFEGSINSHVVAGGDTRFASVAAGLAIVPAEDAIVLVHDAARPLVTPALIRACYDYAQMWGSAVPVIHLADSIRQITASGNRTIRRDELRIVQTPQTFDALVLKKAFEYPYRSVFTDEATVVEWAGGAVELIEGERTNLKITTSEDLLIAEALMQARMAASQ